MDLPHYEAVGGMKDALKRHAERAYGELGLDELNRIAERMFKALTDTGTDPRGIRRPTRLDRLCAICGATQGKVEIGDRGFPQAKPLLSDAAVWGSAGSGDDRRHLA